MRLNSDLLTLINAAVDGTLDQVSLDWKDQPALTVVMAAEGYPSNVKKGSVIRDLDKLEGIDGVKLFHAGTAEKDGNIVASGGRVLNITAIAETVAEAQARAYEAVKLIDWPEGFYRSDIGWRAVERKPQPTRNSLDSNLQRPSFGPHRRIMPGLFTSIQMAVKPLHNIDVYVISR